jgi:hypothetical protein
MLPLFGQVVHRKNRGDREDRHAGSAIDALYGIDVELRDIIEARTAIVVGSVLLRVDAIYSYTVTRLTKLAHRVEQRGVPVEGWLHSCVNGVHEKEIGATVYRLSSSPAQNVTRYRIQ